MSAAACPTAGRLPRSEWFHRGKNGQERSYTISVGFFDLEEREPAEVFVTGPKVGSELETVARDCAILWSIARQYGAPVDVLAHALTQEEDGIPSTVIGQIATVLLKYTLDQTKADVNHEDKENSNDQ